MTISTKNNLASLALFAVIAFFLMAPSITLALTEPKCTDPTNPKCNEAPSYTALEPLPCVPGGVVTCPTNGGLQSTFNFQNYVQYIFNLAIFLSAAAAVFMIVWGGFEYMTTDSWQNKSAGLEKVKNAVIGLLLVLTSYLILRTIDPRLVAIPTTLVAPLNIKYQNANSDLVTSLNSEIDRQTAAYLAQNAEAKAKITEAQNAVAAGIAVSSNLETQITDAATFAGIKGSIQDLCNPVTGVSPYLNNDIYNNCQKLLINNVKVSTDQANLKTQAGIAIIAGATASCLDGTTKNVVLSGMTSTCASNIETARVAALATLPAGQSPVAINDYAASSNAYLQVSNLAQNWDKSSVGPADLGHLISEQNKGLAKITDPVAKKNLTDMTSKLIISLGGTQQQIDSGKYLEEWTASQKPKVQTPYGNF